LPDDDAGPKPATAPAQSPDGSPAKSEARLSVSVGNTGGRRGSSRLSGGLVPVGDGPPKPLDFELEQDGNADPEKPQKTLLVKVFYRGRVGDTNRQQEVVVVTTRDLGPILTVSISQDREALVERGFPRDVAEAFTDQFTEHPDHGYLHSKGQLDYVLTFR